MLIVATHYVLIQDEIHEQPVTTLAEYLRSLDIDFCILHRPLNGNGESWIDLSLSGNGKSRSSIRSVRRPSGVRYVADIILGVTSLWRYSTEQPTFFIGADPINALVGIFLKRIHRVNSTVYYSVDYAPNRFENSVLNSIYHACDRYCVRNSDFVWSVSSRIAEVRRQMGLEESRNIFLPNVPPPNLVALRPDNLDTRFRIVIIGTLNGQQTYRELIDAVKILLAKYPLITLRIIGTGPDFESLQQYVRNHGLWDITEFTGFVNYQKALSLIAESGIGCALYSGEWTFNYFGDSMKCREYLSFGLPILTTDTHSTVSDIREYQAGVVSERTSVGYAHGLEELISHYETYSAAAITLGNKYANAHSQAYALLTTEVGCETGHRGLDPE